MTTNAEENNKYRPLDDLDVAVAEFHSATRYSAIADLKPAADDMFKISAEPVLRMPLA
jgi:hypothetical protein